MDGSNVYRQMPTLYSNQKVPGAISPKFSLSATARRSPPSADTGIWIGDYLVKGAPVLEIVPNTAESTKAYGLLNTSLGSFYIPSYCLADPRLVYGGTRWKLDLGETIKLNLQTQFDFRADDFRPAPADYDADPADPTKAVAAQNGGVGCRDSNLHTHGLLVTPTRPNATTDSYGDYVLDTTHAASNAPDCSSAQQGGGGHHHTTGTSFAQGRSHTDTMKFSIKLPGQQGEESNLNDAQLMASGHHPPGLYWYHPHPHGYSRLQMNGGTTGVITIGKLESYAKDADGKPLLTPNQLQSAQRHIQLKDAQLDCPQTATDCTAASGNWIMPTAYDPLLCNGLSSPESRGECGTDRRKWLFTINGVQFPTIRNTKGGTEIWRLVNASPNVTYRLTLRPRLASGAIGNVPANYKRFAILAVDGVNAPGVDIEADSKELLMMPGSRAEVVMQFAPNEDFVLTQAEVNGGQDPWPSIGLMEVAVPADAQTAANEKILTVNTGGQSAIEVIGVIPRAADTNTPSATDMCAFDGTRNVRYVKFVKRVKEGNNKEIFGLISGVGGNDPTQSAVIFDEHAQPIGNDVALAWNKYAGDPGTQENFPAMGSNPAGGICTKFGSREIWVLENWTNEIHNFHIHQSKFRYMQQRDLASFPPVWTNLKSHFLNTPEVDPANDTLARINALAQAEWAVSASPRRSSLHDTIPIPPGRGINGGQCEGVPDPQHCDPARISIRIDFTRNEQIGDFVYHCHILEHEDLGMMSQIKVLGPDLTASAH